MLPFLKSKIQQPGGIVHQVRPSDSPEAKPDEGSDEGLSACVTELLEAVHAKDTPAAVTALRAAFQILSAEDMPSDEQTESQEGQL